MKKSGLWIGNFHYHFILLSTKSRIFVYLWIKSQNFLRSVSIVKDDIEAIVIGLLRVMSRFYWTSDKRGTAIFVHLCMPII